MIKKEQERRDRAEDLAFVLSAFLMSQDFYLTCLFFVLFYFVALDYLPASSDGEHWNWNEWAKWMMDGRMGDGQCLERNDMEWDRTTDSSFILLFYLTALLLSN